MPTASWEGRRETMCLTGNRETIQAFGRPNILEPLGGVRRFPVSRKCQHEEHDATVVARPAGGEEISHAWHFHHFRSLKPFHVGECQHELSCGWWQKKYRLQRKEREEVCLTGSRN